MALRPTRLAYLLLSDYIMPVRSPTIRGPRQEAVIESWINLKSSPDYVKQNSTLRC